MRQVEFARLCGVSAQAISKHAQAGRLVRAGGGGVDAKASLQALEGHLDEAKRRRALLKLAGLDEALAGSAGEAAADRGGGNVVDFQEASAAISWRGRRDKAAALMAELELEERLGALVRAADIAAAVESMIARFWSETEHALKIDALEIVAELDLDAAQAAKMRAALIRRNRTLRENFARVCRAVAEGARAEAADPAREG